MSVELKVRDPFLSTNVDVRKLSRFPSLPIKVYVFNAATDEQEHEYLMDYNDPHGRERFNRMVIWALTNGRELAVVATKDDKG